MTRRTAWKICGKQPGTQLKSEGNRINTNRPAILEYLQTVPVGITDSSLTDVNTEALEKLCNKNTALQLYVRQIQTVRGKSWYSLHRLQKFAEND